MWLGRRCAECGKRLTGKQKKYCSDGCRDIGNKKYKREYDRKRAAERRAARAEKKKSGKAKKKRGAVLRAAAPVDGCRAAGQPPGFVVQGSPSQPPFTGKKTRTGGSDADGNGSYSGRPMICTYYGHLITAAVCRRRRQRLESSGNYIDVYCATFCRGQHLRPATRAEINRHRAFVHRVAREKGCEVSV